MNLNFLTDCIKDTDTKGANYRGKVAVTKKGWKCERWDSKFTYWSNKKYYCGAKYAG